MSREKPKSFQSLILTLHDYWSRQGCVILQPHDVEVGAGTLHPATVLRALGPKAWNAAYVQPFDDLKLPLNVLAGWLVFGYAPAGYLWLGALLILGASLFLMTAEMRKERTSA